ncbi:hypothetical protein [Tianweitania sediminis]|uniref:TonB family protein n=1 Tax=Tianweitania sediminis TaxID=1502156 RepID=A0A8J7UJL6_9HYPH|nr:hypothetical protein [Tianweitania sediminis]MBP0438945.1 hypothetical protein [Tianweitania sediminis]
MTRPLVFAAALLVSLSADAVAETGAGFAARVQAHFGAVAADPRVRLVALNASPSNVVVEFGLTSDGKARDARIVHSILSQDDQQLVLEALNALPPLAIGDYAASDATYRLPIRLNIVAPAAAGN